MTPRHAQRRECPVWVLGHVSAEEIEAARSSLPPGAVLTGISDEGTVSYCTAQSQIASDFHQARRNWLKESLAF